MWAFFPIHVYPGWVPFPLSLGWCEQCNLAMAEDTWFPLGFPTSENPILDASILDVHSSENSGICSYQPWTIPFSKNALEQFGKNWFSEGSWSSGMSPVTHSPCCQIHHRGSVLGSASIRGCIGQEPRQWHASLKRIHKASSFPIEKRHGDAVFHVHF